jgi:hypothetical protein
MATTNTTVSSSNKEYALKNANSSIIELIAGEQAIEKLQQADDFINNLSPFDLASRLHTSSATVQDYFQLISQHILPWDEQSTQTITSCIEYINTQCIKQLNLLIFPPRIYVILTDGADESNAAYCRNENVIVFPQRMIGFKEIRKIFIHELFHIWSKWSTNLATRDKLYASIGYHKIPVEKSPEFPSKLLPLKMTNPDAPLVMKYYINLKQKNDENEKIYKCTPILHAYQAFDVNSSSGFFAYLNATTLILDDITYQPLEPLQYLSYRQASNFYDQIGNNTAYIIHPEEILADNFVFWMTSIDTLEKLTTPDVVNKMNEIIYHDTNNSSSIASQNE